MSQSKVVLAFDPGGTTGWAAGKYTDTEPLEFIYGGQITGGVDGFVKWMKENTEFPNAELVDFDLTIVSESFSLRPGVRNPDLTPVRIEGALTALVGTENVVYQQPAMKALVSDDRLRKYGLWIPGQRHHMDARIHALAYMSRLKHIPTLRKYWS